MLNTTRRVLARRKALARRFDIAREFERIEESCIPSYLHRNPLAAAVAWWRLIAAVSLFRQYRVHGPVLDFGAASGELGHLLGMKDYEFVEGEPLLAQALRDEMPAAIRRDLAALPAGRYGTIFALDALEHNDDFASILHMLRQSLQADGLLIVSGPTENFLYRLGRKIAGFDGHYHKTNIYDIERAVSENFHRVAGRIVPMGIPLFSISAWRPKSVC